jgi:alpha-1,6-mannosyltransferase
VLLRGLPGPRRLAGPDGVVAGQVSAYAGRAALAFALAWLTAGPYVLPWYDALAWAMLPLLPWSVIDYLVVARTASLAIGYLPARTVAMPSGLGWLVSVVRTAISPALLLIVAILLVISVRSANSTKRAVPAAGSV